MGFIHGPIHMKWASLYFDASVYWHVNLLLSTMMGDSKKHRVQANIKDVSKIHFTICHKKLKTVISKLNADNNWWNDTLFWIIFMKFLWWIINIFIIYYICIFIFMFLIFFIIFFFDFYAYDSILIDYNFVFYNINIFK